MSETLNEQTINQNQTHRSWENLLALGCNAVNVHLHAQNITTPDTIIPEIVHTQTTLIPLVLWLTLINTGKAPKIAAASTCTSFLSAALISLVNGDPQSGLTFFGCMTGALVFSGITIIHSRIESLKPVQ